MELGFKIQISVHTKAGLSTFGVHDLSARPDWLRQKRTSLDDPDRDPGKYRWRAGVWCSCRIVAPEHQRSGLERETESGFGDTFGGTYKPCLQVSFLAIPRNGHEKVLIVLVVSSRTKKAMTDDLHLVLNVNAPKYINVGTEYQRMEKRMVTGN